jgi:SAM-dependent methyltransferase
MKSTVPPWSLIRRLSWAIPRRIAFANLLPGANMGQTAEEFDAWYRRSGGDPWGLDSRQTDKRRLRSTLNFIERHVGSGFSGRFVEMGCFHGRFTEMLARKFPNVRILANDISNVALDEAKRRLAPFSTISFMTGDLGSIVVDRLACGPDILLLLECIYYMSMEEREDAVIRLAAMLSPSSIFISAPMTGAPYFTAVSIKKMFDRTNYRPVDHRVLTWRNWLRSKPNQVIYCFAPQAGT